LQLNNGTALRFKNTAAAAVDTLQMFTDGNVYLDAKDNTGGAIIFRTTTSLIERMRINSNGVKFQNGSSYLSAYEEGSWTPTLIGNATTPTYTSQFGQYTRIGRLVHLVGKIGLSNGSGGGAVTIGGLPYDTGNASDAYQRSSARPEGDFSGFGSAANFSSIMFRANGSNFIGVIANSSGQSAYATYNMYASILYFNFNVTYYI
jgi:hypothetical protein